MKTANHPLADIFKFFLGLALIGLVLTTTQTVFGVGETSTKFGMFVPPNGDNPTRDPMLVVTAVQDNTSVDILDDNADGDSDDSALDLVLNAGQSHIIYIQDGAVNDDLGGKEDGDFFTVTSNKPVILANLTANSNWEHDFLPADNRLMSGTSFYLYRPPGFESSAELNQLLNLFAYSDNTNIQIIDITDTAKTDGGTTSVLNDANGTIIFNATLNAGEDLQEVHGYSVPMPEGHTFHIMSNKDITAMFGAISKGQFGSRDGGTYVPGKNGTSADRTFYFAIPYQHAAEREMRLVSYDKAANVTIRGWNTATDAWDIVTTLTLPKYGHAELIGNQLGGDYYFFEAIADETISIFETSWLETGDFGTSDIVTFISASDGHGAGNEFLAYMGPPARELNTQLSHLYVYSYKETTGIAYDSDNYGEYIELYNNSGGWLSLGGWSLVNAEGYRLTIPNGMVWVPEKPFCWNIMKGQPIPRPILCMATIFPVLSWGMAPIRLRCLMQTERPLIHSLTPTMAGATTVFTPPWSAKTPTSHSLLATPETAPRSTTTPAAIWAVITARQMSTMAAQATATGRW